MSDPTPKTRNSWLKRLMGFFRRDKRRNSKVKVETTSEMRDKRAGTISLVLGLLFLLITGINSLLHAKEQTLQLIHPQQVVNAHGDALQLRQAISNLIGNAIKYSPLQGKISVSIEQTAEQIVITVQDTGYGIPSADLPFIFDRFYRVRDGHLEGIEGNGLGLAIVKSIAERYGGQVSVESTAGLGSCFSFSLPVISNQ